MSRLLIAVTGGSASGKSRLSTALAEHFHTHDACILAEDDYYIDAGDIPGFDEREFNFDEPAAKDHDLLVQHLAELRRGSAVHMPRYDFATHRRRAETQAFAPGRILIVEGMHILANANLRSQFDFSVYVSAGDEIRLERRITRDVAERSRTEEFARFQFETHVRPMHDLHVEPQKPHADMIIRNTGELSFAEMVNRVCAQLPEV